MCRGFDVEGDENETCRPYAHVVHRPTTERRTDRGAEEEKEKVYDTMNKGEPLNRARENRKQKKVRCSERTNTG